MSISATMVKDLREKTGAGMMDCKAALAETSGDMEAAVDWLRAKGLAKAAKKAGRVAAEGLIGLAADAIMQPSSKSTRRPISSRGTRPFRRWRAALPRRGSAPRAISISSQTPSFRAARARVADTIKEMIGTIGENMTLRRTAYLDVKKGAVASYIHNQMAPGLGKIGVIVALESTGDADALKSFGRQVAMHIAAANPQAVDVESLDQAVVERERAVLSEQAKESGKPANVIEKMVEGRIRKFYEEVVLLAQAFVHDPDTTVAKAVAAAEKTAGAPIKITGFHRFALGEGIDRTSEETA